MLSDAQRKLIAYIHGSSGLSYRMSESAKRAVVGMLQTGEITESDFDVVYAGELWLTCIKDYAKENGWTWK